MDHPTPQSAWHPLAALAAWLVPGLGHMVLGERRRGAILAVGISILWVAGFFIGGIAIFDHTDRPEYIVAAGQYFLAPSLAADLVLQKLVKLPGQSLPPMPQGDYPYEPSFGRVNEQGVLYTAMAGYLNLLVIIDALYHERRRPESAGRSIDLAEPAP